MAMLQISTPLRWPDFITPTERMYRLNHPQLQMNMQETEAVAFVEDEINRTYAITSASLSCDAENITSTAPTHYLTKNTGAALEIVLESGRYVIACDRWVNLAHNIYSLHLVVKHFRTLEEAGIGSLPFLLQPFRKAGAAAAQAKEAEMLGMKDWQKVLGLGPTTTLEIANAAYRVIAKNIAESDPEGLRQLNIAIQQARQELS
jgi:hypothetical protein